MADSIYFVYSVSKDCKNVYFKNHWKYLEISKFLIVIKYIIICLYKQRTGKMWLLKTCVWVWKHILKSTKNCKPNYYVTFTKDNYYVKAIFWKSCITEFFKWELLESEVLHISDKEQKTLMFRLSGCTQQKAKTRTQSPLHSWGILRILWLDNMSLFKLQKNIIVNLLVLFLVEYNFSSWLWGRDYFQGPPPLKLNLVWIEPEIFIRILMGFSAPTEKSIIYTQSTREWEIKPKFSYGKVRKQKLISVVE